MIIPITGASHSVKTLLMQKLLEKYNYPCLSIDHLTEKDFTTEHSNNIKLFCIVLSEYLIRNHFDDIKNFANIIETR